MGWKLSPVTAVLFSGPAFALTGRVYQAEGVYRVFFPFHLLVTQHAIHLLIMHSHEWPRQLWAPVPAQSSCSQCRRPLNAHAGASLQCRGLLAWEAEELPGAEEIDTCFSSDLTATVVVVGSNLLKGCSVTGCMGVLWWKALGFWGVSGTFLLKGSKSLTTAALKSLGLHHS